MTTGIGIPSTDLILNIGEWNATSVSAEQENHRLNSGQGLAALRSLATIEIASRAVGEDEVGVKQIDQATVSSARYCAARRDVMPQFCADLAASLASVHHGTVLRVRDMFDSLPVRRKSFQADKELARVKDTVKGLSLLHHTVSWNVLVGPLIPPGGTAGQRRVLLLPAVASVAKRVLQVHGPECAQAMQVRQAPAPERSASHCAHRRDILFAGGDAHSGGSDCGGPAFAAGPAVLHHG